MVQQPLGDKKNMKALNPYLSAAAVWHMGDLNSACGKYPLTLNGEVKVGQALQGEEKSASLARGGDGLTATFSGGYISLGAGDGELNLEGLKEYTFYIRYCNHSEKQDAPILSLADTQADFSGILYGSKVDYGQIGLREKERMSSDYSLEFLHRTTPLKDRTQPEYMRDDPTRWFHYLTTNPFFFNPAIKSDFIDGRLRLSVPVDLIGPVVWHDVIIRFLGYRLEMFIDGVLVDEEWPHGPVSGVAAPFLLGAVYEKGNLRSGFQGQVDELAIWKKALSDEEILSLSGGSAVAAQREIAILVEEPDNVQYWRPRGHNAWVGDCMPFFHEGRFHIFYLFDRRHCHSKWGMGAHQFAHISSTDLRHWDHHPLSIPITDPIECAMGTGDCIFHEGQYYLYYIQHARRCLFKDSPYQGDYIGVAVSKDGIHFEKRAEPVIELNYKGETGEVACGDINPLVFADASGKHFYMYVSGWKILASDDLLHWTETSNPALCSLKWLCTSNIEWNGWYYFFGEDQYRMSKKPLECPEFQAPSDSFFYSGLAVPMAAPFKNNRYLYVGFANGGEYAQELVVRELVQQKDGTLGLKWVEEMIPESGAPLPLVAKPLRGNPQITPGSIQFPSQDGLSIAMFSNLPKNYRLKVKIRREAFDSIFGLCFRGRGSYTDGCELRFKFNATEHYVQFDQPLNESVSENPKGVFVCQYYPFDKSEYILVEAIVKDDFVDVCIDNRHCRITRAPLNNDRLFLFANKGEVRFEQLEIRPLV